MAHWSIITLGTLRNRQMSKQSNTRALTFTISSAKDHTKGSFRPVSTTVIPWKRKVPWFELLFAHTKPFETATYCRWFIICDRNRNFHRPVQVLTAAIPPTPKQLHQYPCRNIMAVGIVTFIFSSFAFPVSAPEETATSRNFFCWSFRTSYMRYQE